MPQENTIEYFGKKIKDLRVGKNISVEKLSEITKISKNHIEAIEEGNLGKFPLSYFYLFTKSLALELGYDLTEDKVYQEVFKDNICNKPSDSILESINSNEGKIDYKQYILKYQLLIKIFLIIIAISLTGLGLWLVYANFFRIEKVDDNLKQSFKVIAVDSNRTVAVRDSVISIDRSHSAIQEKLMLTIKAKKDTWLIYFSDNNKVLEKRLNNQTSFTIEADHLIELKLGNIEDVDISLNSNRMHDLFSSIEGSKFIRVDSVGKISNIDKSKIIQTYIKNNYGR